ncbi:hypothetical protein VHEMI04715 [[Torrubiella] hemipterigena]|uniref:Alcohol dehydrogenase iron-type/glycerol dehydrogenase GldA domain-containing protein n=1 Tax=[Torrubiella] hemipterigena TaxID=1531966 RepID=A0A0A1TEM6_9HYPO|nr:hypothetical protein VHEMI04715 [[Torrubiella] hemipterigena]
MTNTSPLAATQSPAMTSPESLGHHRHSPVLSSSSARKSASSSHRHRLEDEKVQSPSSSAARASFTPKIVYGRGAINRLPAELGALQVSSPLIVASPSRVPIARRIQAIIPNLQSHILDAAVITVPDHVVDDAVERIAGRDVVISVGGSSAVGLARAISIRKEIPHVCIPTTYSSMEITPLFENDAATISISRRRGSISSAKGSSSKQSSARTTASRNSSRQSVTMRDARSGVKPAVIIYDEDLTEISSKRVAAPSTTKKPPPRSDGSEWSFLDLPGI